MRLCEAAPSLSPGPGVPQPGPGSALGLRVPSVAAFAPATAFATPSLHAGCQKELSFQELIQLPLSAQFSLRDSPQNQLQHEELPSSTPHGPPWQAAGPSAANLQANPRTAPSVYSPSGASQQPAGTPAPDMLDGRDSPSGGRKDIRAPRPREVCRTFLLTALIHHFNALDSDFS